MQRIGVFVCHCGTNIAATVDVERVAETLGHEPGVVFATHYPYMCSQTGQDMIREKIAEYALTGVVICSCSPRMHEQTFRKACEKAGLNGYMVEIANIREQCSWIHKALGQICRQNERRRHHKADEHKGEVFFQACEKVCHNVLLSLQGK